MFSTARHPRTIVPVVFWVPLVLAFPSLAQESADVEVEDDPFGDEAEWGDIEETEEVAPEPSFRIHGKFESQLTGMWLWRYGGGNEVSVNNYTRLRVDLDADLPGGLSLRSDAVARIVAGETTVRMRHLLPDRTLDQLVARDPRWAAALEDTYEYKNDYYVDNVYLKVPVKALTLFVGKQPLEQGVGYVWNPTDVFNRKDLFDPTYEKPGLVALRGILAIGDVASLDLMGVPDGNLSNWTGGGRGSVRLGPVTLSASSFVTRVKQTDLEGSMDAMAAAALTGGDPEAAVLKTVARRVMVGGDAVMDVEGVRLWSEGAYNFIEKKNGAPDDWFEIVGGVEYFFPSETHVMAEYLHYGRGPGQSDGAYDFNDWMGVLSNDLKMLGTDFLFESIDQPVFDFWTVGFSSFQSLSDASAAIMGDARWQFAEDAELWFLLSYAVGEKADFLSSGRGQGWLRLSAYF